MIASRNFLVWIALGAFAAGCSDDPLSMPMGGSGGDGSASSGTSSGEDDWTVINEDGSDKDWKATEKDGSDHQWKRSKRKRIADSFPVTYSRFNNSGDYEEASGNVIFNIHDVNGDVNIGDVTNGDSIHGDGNQITQAELLSRAALEYGREHNVVYQNVYNYYDDDNFWPYLFDTFIPRYRVWPRGYRRGIYGNCYPVNFYSHRYVFRSTFGWCN